MKKFFVLLCVLFVGIAHATTVNIDWLMDGSTYAQTTCETGGNFALPTTPTKYGYHFIGWQQNDAVGSWSQSGTPTPTNPIEPTFTTFGNTVLRAVGSGDNFVADTYDPTTRKITRRVGKKVLNGTENWSRSGLSTETKLFAFVPLDSQSTVDWATIVSSHYTQGDPVNRLGWYTNNPKYLFINLLDTFATVTAFKQFLSEQYDAGTPITIYHPLATPFEENYN